MYVHVKTQVKMFADFHQLCISVLKFREISQCGIQMSHSVKNYYSFRQMISRRLFSFQVEDSVKYKIQQDVLHENRALHKGTYAAA